MDDRCMTNGELYEPDSPDQDLGRMVYNSGALSALGGLNDHET